MNKPRDTIMRLKASLADFWRRYRKNRAAVFGLGIIMVLFCIALTAPVVAPSDPFEGQIEIRERLLMRPQPGNWFGTDQLGRDVLSRVIWGSRVSLFIGLVTAAISAFIGITIGSFAGYAGGAVDNLIMRFVDIFLVLPTLFLVIIVVAMFGSSIWRIMVILGLTVWPATARLVRAEYLRLKPREFVLAAQASGARGLYIAVRHILPNAMSPVIVNTSLVISMAILMEAALSFLGLGDPNYVSWGWILYDSLTFFRTAWWMPLFPGLAISIAILSFNMIADGLNDALNPRSAEGRRG